MNAVFSFQSKDRYEFTRESMLSVLADDGFDLLWTDGSVDSEVPALAARLQNSHPRIFSVELNIRGGADAAVRFALEQLLQWPKYDWIGLIENDVVLHPGWFDKLMHTISLAESDGVKVGAASIRGYQSRVLEYRRGYSLDWAIGAGMVLFSREAAEIILHEYPAFHMTMSDIYSFYAQEFHRYIRCVEWRNYDQSCVPTCDWNYAPALYRHGLSCVGAIPSMAHDLQFNVREFLNTDYVDEKCDNLGQVFPPA